ENARRVFAGRKEQHPFDRPFRTGDWEILQPLRGLIRKGRTSASAPAAAAAAMWPRGPFARGRSFGLNECGPGTLR
ncbi:MAG TPA: hypothetical protein VGK70_04325, partial [Thermoanaerobaculia bacterium]